METSLASYQVKNELLVLVAVKIHCNFSHTAANRRVDEFCHFFVVLETKVLLLGS